MSALVFMDTETTGLALDDDIWEFAGIRREPDGTEHRLHLFIDHDFAKCNALPDSFLADHVARFPTHHNIVTQETAAKEIAYFMSGKAHIVGAVPNFDTERITLLLMDFGLKPGWHHHIIDVETLAVGWLNGVGMQGVNDGVIAAVDLSKSAPPWNSDELSRAIGIDPPSDARHTAMGDALWAMEIYDRVMNGGS